MEQTFKKSYQIIKFAFQMEAILKQLATARFGLFVDRLSYCLQGSANLKNLVR
jgi:hypothetical protein